MFMLSAKADQCEFLSPPPMATKNRSKRFKIYHVPNDPKHSSKIRHTAFTANAGKIATRNSFVDVKIPAVAPSPANNDVPLSSDSLTTQDIFSVDETDPPVLHSFNDATSYLEQQSRRQAHSVCHDF
jgi:hypothetical protein